MSSEISSVGVGLGDLGLPEKPVPSQSLTTVANDAARLEEFTRHWDACRASVRAYLSSLLSNRSDAEDQLQEIALIAWKKGPMGQGESAFLAHCMTSARLIGLAASRKYAVSRVRFLPPDEAVALADEVMRQEQAEPSLSNRVLALRACLSRLGENERQLLALRYTRDAHVRLDEVAKSQGKTADALYKMLERLRSKLRDCVSHRLNGENTNS